MAGKAGLFSKLKPKAFPGAGAAAAKKLAAAKGMKGPAKYPHNKGPQPKAPDHEAHRDHEGAMDENAAYHSDRVKDMDSLAKEADAKGDSEKAASLRKVAEHHDSAMKAHDAYLEHVRKADLNDPDAKKTADDLHKQAGEASKTAEREESAHNQKHSSASSSAESKPVPKPPEKSESDLRSEATEASKKGQFNLRDKLDSMADKAKKTAGAASAYREMAARRGLDNKVEQTTSRNLETGKRGGRFYVSASGQKVYVR